MSASSARRYRSSGGVMHAAAGDEDFLDILFPTPEGIDAFSNGGGGQRAGGGHGVFGREAGAEEALNEVWAILLAAGGLGRRTAVEVVGEEGFEEGGIDVAA